MRRYGCAVILGQRDTEVAVPTAAPSGQFVTGVNRIKNNRKSCICIRLQTLVRVNKKACLTVR